MQQLKTRSVGFLVFGSVFTLCAVTLLPAVLTDTSRWRQVEGTVLRSEITGVGDERERSVTYEYEVGGRIYRSRRATLLFESQLALRSEDDVRSIPVGGRIRVYHHPTKPGWAVLDPRINPVDKALCLFVTSLPALGVLGAVIGRFRPR